MPGGVLDQTDSSSHDDRQTSGDNSILVRGGKKGKVNVLEQGATSIMLGNNSPLTITDGGASQNAIASVVATSRDAIGALSSAFSGQQALTRESLLSVSDLASGGEQSTKKTLLWLGLAGAAMYFLYKKS